MTFRASRALAVCLAGAVALTPLAASAAEFFRTSGYGPISRGMGGAAMAFDIGPAGLFSNPATIGLAPDGTWLSGGLEIVIAPSTITNRATGESVTTSKDGLSSSYPLPSFGLTHRFGRYTIGLYNAGESGAGTEFGNDSFLSRTPSGVDTGLEAASRLVVLRAPIGLSARYQDVFRQGDKLHLGIAAEPVYVGINLGLLAADNQFASLAASGALTGSLVPAFFAFASSTGAGGAGHVQASDPGDFENGVEGYGIGGRLGLVYELGSRTRIGMAYNFETKVEDLDGKATLTAINSVGDQLPLEGKLRIRDWQLPAAFAIGIGHQATDELFLTADVVRYFKGQAFDEINMSFDANAGGSVDLSIPQNARDFTVLRVGAAYRLTRLGWPGAIIRVGGALNEESLPDDRVLPLLPAVPTQTIATGLTFALGPRAEATFSYTRAFENSAENPGLPNVPAGQPTNVSRNDRIYGFGLSYKF